ncbi:putative mitochondrial protein, conserved [Aspergillus brasiliensis]|nr:putative mitochondrial protein, conserved [Aspergillus brasiliensis]
MFLRTAIRLPAKSSLPLRAFSSRAALLSDKPPFAFASSPAPPRLPKEEQELFEELQRKSTGAFSTPQINQSPDSEPAVAAEINATGKGEELHPDVKYGVKPEFEGEKNPKTGEIGGPKNEPLRWGAEGDWSYGGRVTDF